MPGLVLVALFAAVLSAAEHRLTDREIEQLLERIDYDRGRLEQLLGEKLKRDSHTSQGELDVGHYLENLQQNVGRVKSRFSPAYAASAEVTILLQLASTIDHQVASQFANFLASGEWQQFAAGLSDLAKAYGCSFPLATGARARRVNDHEVQYAAGEIAKAAMRFEAALTASLVADQAIDPSSQEALSAALGTVKSAARRLASNVAEGRHGTEAAKALLDAVLSVEALPAARPQSRAADIPWTFVRSGLTRIAEAFDLVNPPEQ